MISAREAAYRSLVRTDKDNRYSNLEIDSAIKKYGLCGAEKALYTKIVYGVTERRITLDYYLEAFSVKALSSLDSEVLTVLRIAAYQIMFLSRVPNHAAVNEAVDMAKRHCPKGSAAFINAVLRHFVCEYVNVSLPADRIKYLCVKYSVPEWICSLWSKCYKDSGCEEILRGIDETPAVTLRVNTLVNTRQELLDRLLREGIEACITERSPDGIRLDSGVSFENIDKISERGFFVQDEASQLAVRALGAMPKETVIDTCACPGGKSFGAAMCMENSGKLICLDLHKNKLGLVEKGARRLGIDIIETYEHNSQTALEKYIGCADRVICDVPCSGLGVIAKKPEIRYKDAESIARLPQIQFNIASAAVKYLKPGGTLVYSTCTLNSAENEDVVNRLLCNEPGLKLEKMTTYFPQKKKSDGFFVSVIKKT